MGFFGGRGGLYLFLLLLFAGELPDVPAPGHQQANQAQAPGRLKEQTSNASRHFR